MSDTGDTLSDTSGDITDMDAEPDSDVEQDLDQMLGTWLGELETITQSIDADIHVGQQSQPAPLPPHQSTLGSLDNFSFSAFQLAPYGIGTSTADSNTLEEDQDVDLDALLGDLCQMEIDLQQKIDESSANSASKTLSAPPPTFKPTPPPDTDTGRLPPPPPMPDISEQDGMEDDLPPPPPMNGEARMPPPPEDFPAPPEEDATTPVSPTPTLTPTPGALDSPMTPTTPTPRHTAPVPAPSAPAQRSVHHTQPTTHLDFSAANGSVRAPDVSVTSPTSPSPTASYAAFGLPPDQLTQSVRVKLKDLESQLELDPSLSEEEKAAKLKSEKIKIALEKLKKARVQKLIVRVYMEDGSSKTMFVDETMRVRQVSHMLVEKNHLDERPDWTIIEQIPDLLMERALEDHEHLVTDVMLNWKRETTNRILFQERRDKYAIFKNPQNFLLSQHASEVATQFAEKSKQSLIEEFFNAGNRIPEIEGPLWLKQEGKKSWKKHYFVLRGSGLYYSPKGKSKSTKDIVCLVQFEHTNVYSGMGWKKKHKAPSDHCFALKHPQIQQKSKYIKYLCAEDYRTCQRWIAGLRLAKYNKILLENFSDTQREMTEYASSAESMSQSSSLTDTASLSSMQSSSSSQSSGSLPATHGSSPSNSITANLNAPLVLPPMTAQYRKSSMGNMFSNAWKKGQEAETHHQLSMHRERYSTRSSSLPSGRILDEEPPLDNRPQLNNQSKANSGNTFDDLDVQKALYDLESEICASHPPNNPTPQPPPPTTQQQQLGPQTQASEYHHPYTHTATATRAQQDDIVYGQPMTYAGGPENYPQPTQGSQEIVAKQHKLMELEQQQHQLQQELQHQKLQLEKQIQQQQQDQLKQQLQHQQQLQQQRQEQERRQQDLQRQASERAYQQQQQQLQRHLSMERSQPQQPQSMQRHVSFDAVRSPPSPQPQIQRHVSFERPPSQQQQQQQLQPQIQRQTSVDRAQQGQNLRTPLMRQSQVTERINNHPQYDPWSMMQTSPSMSLSFPSSSSSSSLRSMTSPPPSRFPSSPTPMSSSSSHRSLYQPASPSPSSSSMKSTSVWEPWQYRSLDR
eukprot:XP_011660975.1 PREDICTED: ras-associated and pleckstrin homology domains-containing protein 1 isoform X6 [Strongylocentrotus purpuratus]